MDTSKLFPHQQDAIDSIARALTHNQKKIAVFMPNGTGMTAVTTTALTEYLELNKTRRPNVLIITSGKALQQHLVSRLQGLSVVTEANSLLQRKEIVDTILVLNIQWLSGKDNIAILRSVMPTLPLVIYQGLRTTSTTVSQFTQEYNEAIHLIITDGAKDDETFGIPVFTYSVKEAINDHWFVPFEVMSNLNPPSYDVVSGKDLKTLPAESERLKHFLKISVDSLLARTENEKIIIYCPNRAFMEQLVALIQEKTGRERYAWALDSSIEPEQLKEVVEGYRNVSSEPFVLCSLTTSQPYFDLACTQFIAIFNWTNNLSVLQRMLLPGLRPYRTKTILKVLDFVGLDELFRDLNFEHSRPIVPEPTKLSIPAWQTNISKKQLSGFVTKRTSKALWE